MCLEVGGLVGDQSVGGGVGLVEAVAREEGHQVEDVGGVLLLVALLGGPLHEGDLLLRHHFWLLLAHGAPQQVCTSEAVARHLLGGLHDLFLVDHHAVGGRENVGQAGVGIHDLLAAVLALHEVVHHARAEGTRSVQRHRRDDVLEAVRQQALEQPLHARGLQLEDVGGLTGLQQMEGGLVLHRDAFEQEGGAASVGPLVDQLAGDVEHRQRLQAEEVELDEAGNLAHDVVFPDPCRPHSIRTVVLLASRLSE